MRTTAAIATAAVLSAHAVHARDLCEMLRDKGTLGELEFNECRAAQEKKDAQLNKDAQEFTKSWVQYKEGAGFIFNDAAGRFQLSLGNRIQGRYTFSSPDSPSKDESSAFRVRRLKTFMAGHAYQPWLKYKVQVNWVGGSANSGNSPDLEDAHADLAKWPFASLRVGQYKTPFDRQELTSSGAQQFVDRAVTNGRFTFGRDQGVMVYGMLGEAKAEWFEYSAGVFNGNGRNRSDNDNPDHLGVGRIQWMPFGPMKYSESDTDNTPRPLLAVGGAYGFNPVRSSATVSAPDLIQIPDPSDPSKWVQVASGKTVSTTTVSEAEVHRLTADAHLKWRGLSALGEYFMESRDNRPAAVSRTVIGTDGKAGKPTSLPAKNGAILHTHGFNAQAGYFILPRTLEIAARYAMYNPDKPDNRVQEARGGVNYFVAAHNLKVQADAGTIMTEVANGPDTEDLEARLQLQVIF